MHRVTALYILTPILGAGGFACLAPAVGAGMAGSPGAGPALLAWVGTVLLSAAAATTASAALLRRKEVARLAAESAAATSAADAATKAADAAALRTKGLELQLKIATAERQHAEAIIYSITDAVLVTDTFDELVLANEPAARTFQFELDGAHRRRVDQILKDPKFVSLIREMRQGAGGRGRRVVEHRVHTPGGVRTFKTTLSTVSEGEDTAAEAAAPAAPPSGGTGALVAPAPAGVVAVLHDITHEKEISEMKNDFVSNVSHELRTPLASIKAYVELLIDGEADDEKTKREFYEVIQNEANRLGRLIDNILNISRIESGLVKIEKKPQSLNAVVKDALEVIAPQAAQKDIRIVERLAPAFFQTPADRDMLYQAVLNILGNAVKYTPAGGEVRIETLLDETRRKVVTRVSDTGVGIPPADLPFVFDKFYRGEANGRVAPGTGLGLSLVKHIVEVVHHGRVFAESQLGKGSTFGFELDLCE